MPGFIEGVEEGLGDTVFGTLTRMEFEKGDNRSSGKVAEAVKATDQG